MQIDDVVKSELRNIKAKSKREGVFKNHNSVRDFTFLIDEPYKLGGSDQAPTPMEYVLGSFNGCILIVNRIDCKRNRDFRSRELNVGLSWYSGSSWNVWNR